MAITVAQPLANQVVKKMPAGSSEPRETRSAIIPDGKIASADVLIARNIAIAFVAVPGRLLSLSSSCIALMPNGVAAFTSPSMLADMFMTMAPMAGLPLGMLGNRNRMRGLTARAIESIAPASSTTFISPRKNVIEPTSPMASSTALLADVRTPSVNASI